MTSGASSPAARSSTPKRRRSDCRQGYTKIRLLIPLIPYVYVIPAVDPLSNLRLQAEEEEKALSKLSMWERLKVKVKIRSIAYMDPGC